MLGKLIKHDLKVNWNIFLLMYGVLLALAVGTFLSMSIELKGNMENDITEVLSSTLVATLFFLNYMVAVIAVTVMSYVLIVRRFFTNLFGSEGYLTFTLPVTAVQHYGAKLISGLIILLVTSVVQIGSVSIVAIAFVDSEVFAELSDILNSGIFPVEIQIEVVDVVGTLVLGCLESVLGLIMIYAAICIGQMARQKRVLASVVCYFALSTVYSMMNRGLTELYMDLYQYQWLCYVIGSAALILLMAGLSAISILIMQKRVNLE